MGLSKFLVYRMWKQEGNVVTNVVTLKHGARGFTLRTRDVVNGVSYICRGFDPHLTTTGENVTLADLRSCDPTEGEVVIPGISRQQLAWVRLAGKNHSKAQISHLAIA